jgi:Mn-dependent DtxR family transcriptional regulator
MISNNEEDYLEAIYNTANRKDLENARNFCKRVTGKLEEVEK